MRTILPRFIAIALAAAPALATAQVDPPDESLTDLPSTEAIEPRDSTALVTPENLAAAAPSEVVRRGGLFRRRGRLRDSAYVDTLGVGFFNKVLAPVYPNPERAAVMSLLLPGAGQLYNKRFAWLKIPVIYGGYGFLIYRGIENRRLFKTFDEAYRLQLDGEEHVFTGTRFDSERILLTQRNRYDKNFQLSYIGLAIFHLVQTLEAYTTAHLLEFDMDESLTLAPTMLAPPRLGAAPADRARVAVAARWTF